MADGTGKVRLYVEGGLAADGEIALERDQGHYLFSVMRLAVGDSLRVFNGRDGEWRAEIVASGRQGRLRIREQTGPQRHPPDLWLLFAPVKKARTDFIVEKATELGAARIRPVQTRFTNAERVRPDRLRRIAIEAAEQCGETHVPEVAEPVRLTALLDAWPSGRRLVFCDESGAGRPADAALAQEPPGPWAILIGPEGGFAEEERERLRAMPFVLPVTLGPRILRADTAAVAALALWQTALGDWR